MIYCSDTRQRVVAGFSPSVSSSFELYYTYGQQDRARSPCRKVTPAEYADLIVEHRHGTEKALRPSAAAR